MTNYIQEKTRYLKALMLTMLVGIIGFEAGAQIFISSTPPATPWYAGQEATASYEAEDFDAGTTFILWDDADNDTQIDEGEQIFGESTVQDALEEIDFSWPQAGNVNLRLAAFSGNSVTGEIISFTNADVTAIGTNSGGNFLTFDRASARSLTTDAIDLDTSEPVVLSLTYDGVFASGPDAANPVEFLYSTDGFATASTALTDDNLAANEFENIFQVLEFTLPNGAKTANTSFRIQQKGTVDYGTDKNWQVRTSPAAGAIQVEIGETYTNIQDELVDNNNVLLPELTINTVLDADDVPGGTIFPGDEITVEAELQGIDLTGLDFAVRLTNTNTDETFLLENQTPATVDNGTKEITVVGTVPTNISYYNAVSGWDVDIYAFEGTEIQFGTSGFYNFTGGLPTDFKQTAGDQNGSGLVFDQSGERSVTTSAYSISTESDGVLTFNASRKNDILSPVGTDLIVEYATNGGAYTALGSVDINSLSFGGTTEVVVDGWPAGVVSESTQFRIRQASNNGSNLDAFIIANLEIQSGTNLISETFIGRGFATSAATVQSPNITINNIDFGGDGQAFPMEELTLTYDITAGAFPDDTKAIALIQRSGDPELDVIIGETTAISGESILIKVPPLVAGDYTVYLATLNGETYFSTTLSIYDLGLDITSVEYTDPVMVAGDEFTYPGSGLTVNYTLQGTPGAGAELIMSVYDNNPDVDDWVMIGSTTTLSGTIIATLPSGVDYDNNPEVRLSVGSGGVHSNSFNESVINDTWYGEHIPSEMVHSTQGTSDTYINDGLDGAGVRSVTSVPFNFLYGGNISLSLYSQANFTNTFDVRLEGSVDGENWEEIDIKTFTTENQIRSFNSVVPNDLWSENFQFRIIYNEDEAFGFGDNVVTWYFANISKPSFLEVVLDDAPFDLILPSLAVSDYAKTSFAMGEEVSINYNALGFPAATNYAAVVEQNGEHVVAGTASAEDAGTINATMPLAFGQSNDPYDLTIVPFQGTDYKQGDVVDLNKEEDFLVVSGQDPGFAADFNLFDFDRAGNRELRTRAIDLSGISSATLNFDFNTAFGYGSSDLLDNKNTVPRLESSIDGGATFQLVEVYELEVGEQQIYDHGLIYLNQGYSIEIPASLLTEATHFRWSQPLNLGKGENRWDLQNISITLNDDNRIPAFSFTNNVNGNNPEAINIEAPSLDGYAWMQTDLDDAVFNGEDFSYSWNYAEGYTAADVDAFPAGTEFKFYLANGGDYIIDSETGLPYEIGSTTALGEFEAQVPFFVENGAYDMMMSASVIVDEETVYFYGDEKSGVDVGDVDVFLRAIELVYQGDPNATIYAGQDVTFSINIENDETNQEATADLYANLIFDSNEGDIVLATQQGMGDITIALPTDYSGTGDFRLELSEDAPIAEVGTLLENSDYTNLNRSANQFTAGEVPELEVISDYIYETQFTGNAAVFFSYNYQKMGSQNLVAEFSINNGAYQTLTQFGNGSGSPGYYLPSQLRDNPGTGGENIRYRFRLSNNEIDGSTFEITNFRIDINYSSGIFIYPNLNQFGGSAEFEESAGRRLLTTRDFTAEELADAARLTFDVDFDQVPGNLTASQYIAFEYATDGGTSYTPLETYPDMDAEVALSGDGFTYPITADMKENGVRFRWRQEEAKGDFSIDNIDIIFGKSLPFDYVDETISIKQQALMVTGISAIEGCLDSEVTLDYEIRGRFGADNSVNVDYMDVSNAISSIGGYEFNLVEGSGQLTFEFSGNTLSSTADNGIFKFRLGAEDQTTDNTLNVDGNFSEENYELAAPINTNSSFSVNDPLACSLEDVMVTIDAGSMQDYFFYEIIDKAGTVMGSLLRDPEDYQNEINIGQIAAATEVELRITSQSSNGTACNTIIVDEKPIEVLQNFELYSRKISNSSYILVQPDDELSTCNGAEEVSLSVGRLLEDGSIATSGTTLVEWFRDDLNNLVATGTSIDDDGDIEVSGAYFARVTTNSCVYTTESIKINITETPAQPVITVVSGDLQACSSADPVVLAAPEGFAYYAWSNGGTSRTISVESQGSYSVEVSNVPFDIGCSSDASASVTIDRYHVPEFAVRNDDTNALIGAGELVNTCESINIEFMDGTSNTNSGNVQIIKDGAGYAATTDNDYEITESGAYSFVWNVDALNVSGCTTTSVEFTVNIVQQPTASPTLTSTGDLSFCEGEGTVVLTAPAGSDYYRWRRDGTTITDATQDLTNTNTLEVSNAGIYTVEVGNAAGCYSPQSNAIAVIVIAEPGIPNLSQVNSTCGPGELEFSIFNGNGSAMTYQLYNGNTGIASGNPVTINSGFSGIAVTDIVEEDNTPFYVKVSYADGTGCSNVDPSIFTYGNVRNITLEMEGSRLIVKYDGSATVRWYRNGVLLENSTANSIHITDNAEYTVEVEYTSGCVDTGSPADLRGEVPSNGRIGVSMDVNTYPNPSSSLVNLNLVSGYMGTHRLVITSISGQVMKTDNFEKNSAEASHTISISDLETGIYRLQIQYDGQVKSVNIIKK